MERVADLMTPNPVVVSPTTPLAVCARMMQRLGLRHLPVVQAEGVLLGVLTDYELFSRGGLAGGGELWVTFEGVEARVAAELPLHPIAEVTPAEPLLMALRLLSNGENEALLVTEPPRVPVGILTEHDGVRLAATQLPDTLLAGESATHAPLTVSSAAPVDDLMDRMAERGVRHLLVEDHGNLVGVLSARDIITANLGGRARPRVHDLLVRTEVVRVNVGTPLRECAALMVRRHIGCLPVVSSRGTAVGIVTRPDLIRSCVSALEEQALFGDASP